MYGTVKLRILSYNRKKEPKCEFLKLTVLLLLLLSIRSINNKYKYNTGSTDKYYRAPGPPAKEINHVPLHYSLVLLVCE